MMMHPDDDLSCIGPARVRNVAPFRIRLWYSNSVPNEPAHRSPRNQHMRMTLKPNSLKSEVGIRVQTPTKVTELWKGVTKVTALWKGVTKVTALWRGVKNTSTRASMLMASLKRSVLQTARMGPMRRWMRAREKVAAFRRGVILRRRRVMRMVTRMRKRVTRKCGMRCRKPYRRWGMTITTRPFFGQGLKRRDPLHQHHPGRQCGLRICLVYLYLLVSMCTTPSIR